LIGKLANLKAELNVSIKQKEVYERINKKIRIFDLFLHATSKRGVPVQIIDSLLPQINREISKILKGVVGFTVELDADLDSNAMDIYINYGDSKRIIELGSGMEKMMASLAIRVALINISSLPKTSMLMIDEGFGTLDENNLESCGNLLRSLKKWFKNIIIISHIDAIKDIVDNTIEIRKAGVDSYVWHD
jgi:exonuclease SbcC